MKNNIYEALGQELADHGKLRPNGHLETLGTHIEKTYNSLSAFKTERDSFRDYYKGDWYHKQMMEEMHYKKLEGGLLHAINENKYYLKEHINESRRFVVTSTDCITSIQFIFREDEIFVGVYFRSSHYDNLLPVDLDFIYGLLEKAVQYIHERAGSETYEEIDQDLIDGLYRIPIKVGLSFGSLHTNA